MKIFIYCDDPSHARRVAVTNFQSLGNGRWNEVFTARRPAGWRDSGTTLRPDNSVYHHAGDRGQREQLRSSYELVCRKCPRRPVRAREENLFAALNRLAQLGEESVSLGTFAAILQLQSEGN